MDNFFKLIFFYFFSFSVFSGLPALPSYSVAQSGVTTTYTVGANEPYTPASYAPTGPGVVSMNNPNAAVSGSAYVSNSQVKSGATIAAVKVTSPVSNAAIVSSLIGLVAKSPLTGVLLAAGGAAYDYMSSKGVTPDGSGGFLKSARIDSPQCDGDTSDHYINTGSGFIRYYYANVCPVGTDYSGCGPTNRICEDPVRYSARPAPSPSTAAKVEPFLNSYPPSPAEAPEVIADVAKNSPADAPASSSPTVTAPASSAISAPTKTVSPDGTVQTQQTQTDYVQVSPQSFSATERTTTTNTSPAGVTTTTITEQAPAAPPAAPLTDCEKNPAAIGCANLGTPSVAEVLPTVAATVSISPISLGAGSCPASPSMATSRGSFTLSMQPTCDFATMIAPLFIALCWLVAGYIVFGQVKE